MSESKNKKELPVNPENCWSFFLYYSFNTVFTLFHIIYLLSKISFAIDLSSESTNIASFSQILQASLLSISLLGYAIFQIPVVITYLQHIFEEVPLSVSFKKSVNWAIRSQWFIPIFILCMILIAPVTLTTTQVILIILSLINDIVLSNCSYKKHDVNVYKTLQFFSICLYVAIVATCDLKPAVVYTVYKIFKHFFDKKVRSFIEGVYDKNIIRRMKLLGGFLAVNAVLCVFFIMNNVGNIVEIGCEDNEVFNMIVNFFKSLLGPNVTKMVTYFM